MTSPQGTHSVAVVRFSREAIAAAQRTVEGAGGDFVSAAEPAQLTLTDLPATQAAIDRLDERWRDRLDADRDVFDALSEALGTVWRVMSEADGELAAFLDGTRVADE